MNGKLAIAGDNTETGIALLQDALKTIEESFCLLVPTVTGALAGGIVQGRAIGKGTVHHRWGHSSCQEPWSESRLV
jgi:hypothetical protein